MLGKNTTKKSMMKKQIPTILGLLILVGALIAGLIFFGEGTGVFAPRATPETTPKQIRVTNIKDNSFTVSFYTEEKTAGFVKYGTDPNKLNSQVNDDRDQLSGTVGEYQLHHITVRGLDPATDYYYVLGTGSRAEFDNEGQPFQITTAVKPSTPPPEAKTVYGSVSNENGTPAEGSIVYLAADGMGDASSLVKASGSWAVPLSQMRTVSGNEYADLEDETQLSLLVQGVPLTKRIQIRLTVAEAQPVPELTFGKEPDLTKTTDASAKTSPSPSPNPTAADQPQEPDSEASISGQLQDLLDEAEPLPTESTASSELLIGELKTSTDSAEITYTTESPKIKGKLKPNTEVKIEVHSDNQYEQTVTTDEEGYFELDLEALKATLEPGEHTVTYSYIDPDTGEEVIETETFWVEDSDSVKLAQGETDTSSTTSNFESDTSETDSGTTSTLDSETSLTSTPTPTSSIPYGSGSPYPMTTSTSTPTPISATSSSTATDSTTAARQQPVATDSSPQAGSIEATLLLVIGGMFFILMGGWSWWLASELDE
jgi:hypothetical protein